MTFSDILDGLTGNWVGHEADEIAGVAGFHRNADLAIGLESADTWPMPGARIDHHERATGTVDLDAGRWFDAYEAVVHRPFQVPAVGY
jgi:hypothetical protein